MLCVRVMVGLKNMKTKMRDINICVPGVINGYSHYRVLPNMLWFPGTHPTPVEVVYSESEPALD